MECKFASKLTIVLIRVLFSLQRFSEDGSPVSTGSRAPDGGTATASGFGAGTVVRTRAISGQLSSSSNSGITLPDAVVGSVQELL